VRGPFDHHAAHSSLFRSFQTKYVSDPDIDQPLRMQRGAVRYYFEGDGVGNVTELVGVLGNVLERYGYDAYGTPTITDAS